MAKHDWQPERQYHRGDLVSWKETQYRALDDTLGEPPDSPESGSWVVTHLDQFPSSSFLEDAKGEWSEQTDYITGDIVFWNGSLWVSYRDGAGHEPVAGDVWWLEAFRGQPSAPPPSSTFTDDFSTALRPEWVAATANTVYETSDGILRVVATGDRVANYTGVLAVDTGSEAHSIEITNSRTNTDGWSMLWIAYQDENNWIGLGFDSSEGYSDQVEQSIDGVVEPIIKLPQSSWTGGTRTFKAEIDGTKTLRIWVDGALTATLALSTYAGTKVGVGDWIPAGGSTWDNATISPAPEGSADNAFTDDFSTALRPEWVPTPPETQYETSGGILRVLGVDGRIDGWAPGLLVDTGSEAHSIEVTHYRKTDAAWSVLWIAYEHDLNYVGLPFDSSGPCTVYQGSDSGYFPIADLNMAAWTGGSRTFKAEIDATKTLRIWVDGVLAELVLPDSTTATSVTLDSFSGTKTGVGDSTVMADDPFTWDNATISPAPPE